MIPQMPALKKQERKQKTLRSETSCLKRCREDKTQDRPFYTSLCSLLRRAAVGKPCHLRMTHETSWHSEGTIGLLLSHYYRSSTLRAGTMHGRKVSKITHPIQIAPPHVLHLKQEVNGDFFASKYRMIVGRPISSFQSMSATDFLPFRISSSIALALQTGKALPTMSCWEPLTIC